MRVLVRLCACVCLCVLVCCFFFQHHTFQCFLPDYLKNCCAVYCFVGTASSPSVFPIPLFLAAGSDRLFAVPCSIFKACPRGLCHARVCRHPCCEERVAPDSVCSAKGGKAHSQRYRTLPHYLPCFLLCVRACVRACVNVRERACMCACVCACVCV